MDQQAVYVSARWQVKANHMQGVIDLLKELVTNTRLEPGNLFYYVGIDDSKADSIILLEGYADESALSGHRNSPHYREIVVEKIIPLLVLREVVVSRAVSI